MKKYILISLNLVIMSISCSKIEDFDCIVRGNLPENSFITSEKASKISETLCNYVDNQKVPCIQLTIIDSLGNIWSIAVGTTDRKRKHTVNSDNLFRLASITKTFTATIILKLVEQGKITLEDKLSSYFPEYSKAKNVTIKNLLNHSSGIKELLKLPGILTSSTLFTTKIWDINDIVKTISAKNLEFTTGSDFQYSNTNYVLLGLIAEKVTKKDITELYKEFIFNPLNISKLTLVPQEKTPETLISGYDRKLLPTPGIYEITPQNTAWASAAFTSGALIGNSEQTGIFFHNLLTGKLLPTYLLGEMEDFDEKIKPDNDYQKYFGLGLFKFEINRNMYYGHEGLFVGADNIASFRVRDRVTIIILSNISTFDKFSLLKEIDNDL